MKNSIIIALVFSCAVASGQNSLSLRQAMDLALKNNYELRLVRNNAQAARLSNTTGMAGGLPAVSAGARDRESLTDIDQRFSNGTTISRNDVSSNALTADMTVSYTLFNGFRVQAEKQRLDAMMRSGESELVSRIQSTLADVTFRYYDVLRQQDFRRALETSRSFSLKKLEIIDARSKAGLSNDADLLQARIDVNTSDQQLAEQDLMIRRAQVEFLLVVGIAADSVVDLADTMIIDRQLNRDSVMRFIDLHPEMAIAAARVEMDQQSLVALRSQRLPALVVDGSYGYVRTESAAGFSLLNSSNGPSVGLSLRIPLYNGGAIRTQEKVARLQVENSMIEEDRTRQRLIAQVVKAFAAYRTSLDQLDKQEESFRYAGSVLDIQMTRFRQGLSTILDLRSAQAGYEQTASSLVNARFVAKIAETELDRLSCSLGD